MASEVVTPTPTVGARPVASARTLAVAALALITAAAFGLRFATFGGVPGNSFYDAAVRSMGESWHNFFYGALEPGGQVSVDKTPIDLWLQVATTKVLGFNSTAMRLPEATGGALAVPLLYDLVRRLSGRVAGLGAAAALAVMPISVLTSHSDTMDSLMMALDIAAAWLVVVGAQRRSIWLLVAAGAVLGLDFNVKLFEALFVLPALVVLAWLAYDLPRARRLGAIAAGAAAFVAVSVSWLTAVSLTPAHDHPWPFGSTNGSVWDVVFGYNGIDRLHGHASAAALALDPPGPLRFVQTSGHDYAALVGSSLVAAIVLGGAALVLVMRRRPAGRRPSLAGAAFVAVWLVLAVVVMSKMQRFEPRYLEAATPAIAAAIGIGIAWLASRAPQLLAACATVAAAVAIVLVAPPTWAIVIAAAGVVAGVGLALRRRASVALAACALAAVLAVPTASAVTVARDHGSDAGLFVQIPGLDALSAFLRAQQGQSRYEVASTSVMRVAPLIIHDGRPVLMLTADNRPLLTPARLEQLVRNGEIRYLLIGTGAGPLFRWALAHAHRVHVPGVPDATLYRLSA
ncbi:MAG TPA: glycosyltransferase family 39 protein [Baekduia sp.]|nr:glycosyltransferase family 39 protein [Baekduia sp.]